MKNNLLAIIEPRRSSSLRQTMRAAILSLSLSVAWIPSSHAQTVVLTFDISNPAAVIISATGAFATTTDSSQNSGFGVDLLGLFTADASSSPGGGLSGNLSGGGAAAYDTWSPDNLSTGSSFLDLNLFLNFGSDTESFSTTSAAFTGSSTADLSGLTGFLPPPGTTGDIQAGWSQSNPAPGPVIGQYKVISGSGGGVPEPSVTAWSVVFGSGLAGFALVRKRSARV